MLQTASLEALLSQRSQLLQQCHEVVGVIRQETSKIQEEVTQQVATSLAPILAHGITWLKMKLRRVPDPCWRLLLARVLLHWLQKILKPFALMLRPCPF